MSKRDLILQEALALDDADRAYVIDRLQQSLPSSSLFASQEIAEEWSAEIDRRIEAAERGEGTALSKSEFIERLRNTASGRDSA
jgi:putative addiction module component (TIGR02574 family)